MNLIRCDRCDRTEPLEQASGWLLVMRDGEPTAWNFCSVTCLAAWSADAL